MNHYEECQRWYKHRNVDENTIAEIEKLSDSEIREQFGSKLQFGTGGLRALLGVGPNRLNIYTVRKNTEGVARYIENTYINGKNAGVVIAYDNRYNSSLFAKEVAAVLANHQIKSYLFDDIRPTPELSFAIRELKAIAGIVITASHNPKEYNGYKVYNSKGGQCVPSETSEIIKYINLVEDELSIDIASETVVNKYCEIIGENIDNKYYEALFNNLLIDNTIDKSDFKIIFSPLHGTAYVPVIHMLRELNYNVTPVQKQCTPDPEFSYTKSPNPENIEAYEEGIKIANEIDADIVITTDPDCDRLGVAVKHEDDYTLLSGNQTGAILLDYILNKMKYSNTLPQNGIVFNTIVTSDFGKAIADFYGVKVESTLTGFKFIGEKIGEYEDSGEYKFIFGYEESFGYLFSEIARDKDGVQSCVMIAEVAAYYKNRGKTLIDVLNNLYEKYGYYRDAPFSLMLDGIEGKNKMSEIMETLRNTEIVEIAGVPVIGKDDLKLSKRILNQIETEIFLPKSNVLKFYLEDGSWIAIRPSGTEPKFKFYICIKAQNEFEADEKQINYKKYLLNLVG